MPPGNSYIYKTKRLGEAEVIITMDLKEIGINMRNWVDSQDKIIGKSPGSISHGVCVSSE